MLLVGYSIEEDGVGPEFIVACMQRASNGMVYLPIASLLLLGARGRGKIYVGRDGMQVRLTARRNGTPRRSMSSRDGALRRPGSTETKVDMVVTSSCRRRLRERSLQALLQGIHLVREVKWAHYVLPLPGWIRMDMDLTRQYSE